MSLGGIFKGIADILSPGCTAGQTMLGALHGRTNYPSGQAANQAFIKPKSPQKGQPMVPNEDNLSFTAHIFWRTEILVVFLRVTFKGNIAQIQ